MKYSNNEKNLGFSLPKLLIKYKIFNFFNKLN